MWGGRGGSPGRLIGFIYVLRAGCSSHTRHQPCLASRSSSPGPRVASRTMRQSRRVGWMKEHLEVMALEGPPSNVYGGFTRSVCVQCQPQWGRVQWWGGLTTQALRVGRESSYVQQGKERERAVWKGPHARHCGCRGAVSALTTPPLLCLLPSCQGLPLATANR